MAKAKNEEVKVSRRNSDDRRGSGGERRKQTVTVAVERRDDQRRKTPRRRQIDPTTCERDYSNDEIEFMHALDAYKRANGRMFPTCSEILEVIRGLGYVRTTPATSNPPAPSPSSLPGAPLMPPLTDLTEFGSPAGSEY